ncbi:hypothetical protein [Kitasatospora purpeofusca]|uniref:hypothetical protein n=1 Tax=Kitasatospora purpeofusca TaxID=67352 RepID=UPI003812F9FC
MESQGTPGASLAEFAAIMNKANQDQAPVVEAKATDATQEDMANLQITADTTQNIAPATQGLLDGVRDAQRRAAETVRD